MTMTLYDFPDSGNGYKVRLLLSHLGIAYRYVEIDILRGESRTPEFLAKKPNGRIPVLELDDGTFLSESDAILFYLAEGSRYVPEDRLGRAQGGAARPRPASWVLSSRRPAAHWRIAMDDSRISRGEFVKTVVGTAAVAGLAGTIGPLDTLAQNAARDVAQNAAKPVPMPLRPLGRTGHPVRIFSLGGQATLERAGTEEQSLAIIHRAIDLVSQARGGTLGVIEAVNKTGGSHYTEEDVTLLETLASLAALAIREHDLKARVDLFLLG